MSNEDKEAVSLDGSSPSELGTASYQYDEASAINLFPGDDGTLTYRQRLTLHAIMRNRYISFATHPMEWEVLVESMVLIKSRLNDLLLDLSVNTGEMVAFKRQAIPDMSGRFPTLLHDRAYSREETILMVFLRQRELTERSNGAEHTIVGQDEMIEFVGSFRPQQATDRAADERRTTNAIESLVSARVLLKTEDPERFSIVPILPALMSLEKLYELKDWLVTESGAEVDEQAGQEEGGELK